MYLIDTNVISELRKQANANVGVATFFRLHPDDLYLSVITIGELRAGVGKLQYRGDTKQAALLAQWVSYVVIQFGDRVLEFNAACANEWAAMMAPNKQHPIDKQIAAIAKVHGLRVVTRNVRHFQGTGVPVENPFS
ncbi:MULTISPECIES: type II toxin-antitoxin system VapC family toxin [Chromobacterium]|uniref:type II toxin-antitoxin system VapC family toxin n=1 Tax=Chromobacterium TaxID=535 RepID=UPI001B329ABB|nr:type II toxin-antitoxin system VapC family toxin [Chromobacterium violaceum]